MRALQGERGRKWERTKSKEWQRGCFSFQWSFWVMVKADKRTALALGNPVLKVNPHVIPYKTNPTMINVASFVIQIVIVLTELKCISAYNDCRMYCIWMQHICNMHGMFFRILLPFLSLVSLIFCLSHSFSGFSYLCGNDIMLQCFSFPLLRLSGLFVVNAVLLSFLCLHKIKGEENKL